MRLPYADQVLDVFLDFCVILIEKAAVESVSAPILSPTSSFLDTLFVSDIKETLRLSS